MSGVLLLVGNITPDKYYSYESVQQEFYRKRDGLQIASISFPDAPPEWEGVMGDWFDETLKEVLRSNNIAAQDVRSVVGDEQWAVYLEHHGLQTGIEEIHFPNLELLYVVRVGNNGQKWFEDIFSLHSAC